MEYPALHEVLLEGSMEVRPVEFFLVEQPVRQSVGSLRHDGDTSSTRLFGCEYMRAPQGVLLRASHENARRQEITNEENKSEKKIDKDKLGADHLHVARAA
ncbi:hypothetical protein M0802_007355 [Mischocyttarus mexicanus]|nr:hypothetical protein M0802_007355 [Mischocyttarus mexicanus]